MVKFKVMNKYSQAQLNPTAYASVENYVPPPAQFADKPQKKKIKFVKKKKPPAKEPEPQKKKIKFKVKPKPKTELEKFTGLNKEKANELEVLALFGMLPPELKKNILTPSNTGTQVGSKAKDHYDDIKKSDEFGERHSEINDNINQYAYQYQDYSDYIKKSRDNKFYNRVNAYLRQTDNNLSDLDDFDIEKYETIEEEVRYAMSDEATSVMETQLNVWGETQGNTAGSLEYFIRSFNEHMFDY